MKYDEIIAENDKLRREINEVKYNSLKSTVAADQTERLLYGMRALKETNNELMIQVETQDKLMELRGLEDEEKSKNIDFYAR